MLTIMIAVFVMVVSIPISYFVLKIVGTVIGTFILIGFAVLIPILLIHINVWIIALIIVAVIIIAPPRRIKIIH